MYVYVLSDYKLLIVYIGFLRYILVLYGIENNITLDLKYFKIFHVLVRLCNA